MQAYHTAKASYHISLKEYLGCSFKSQSSRRGNHFRRVFSYKSASLGVVCSFHFVDIQTQFFPTVVSRHINATYDEIGNTRKMESVKKPYENGKVTKQYKREDYKTISVLLCLLACILV